MTKKLGYVIKTDGTGEEFEIGLGLESYQKAVGGYIEGVDFNHPMLRAYANEDGYGVLPVNELATMLHSEAWDIDGQTIFGDVVFYGGIDDEGDESGLDPKVMTILKQLVAEYAENHRPDLQN